MTYPHFGITLYRLVLVCLFQTVAYNKADTVFVFMENIDTDYIENAVVDLVELLGVKKDNDIDYFSLVSLVRDNKIKDCIQNIALLLGLPIEIDVSFVNEYTARYGNAENKFETSELVKTDNLGRGSEGIVAQVLIPRIFLFMQALD